MRRTDLAEATMQGWARLDAAQRQRFFEAFLKAALRLDALALRAWLRRRLKNPPLAAPIDPARFTISDADMALAAENIGRRAASPSPAVDGITASTSRRPRHHRKDRRIIPTIFIIVTARTGDR